jgi:hypothetical protein
MGEAMSPLLQPQHGGARQAKLMEALSPSKHGASAQVNDLVSHMTGTKDFKKHDSPVLESKLKAQTKRLARSIRGNDSGKKNDEDSTRRVGFMWIGHFKKLAKQCGVEDCHLMSLLRFFHDAGWLRCFLVCLCIYVCMHVRMYVQETGWLRCYLVCLCMHVCMYVVDDAGWLCVVILRLYICM